jgi:hypothetical protein
MKGKIDGSSALVGILAGCLAGGCAGYLVGRYVSKRKMERELDSEVAKLKSHYRAAAEEAPVRRDYTGGSRPSPPVGIAGRFSDLTLTSGNAGPGSRIISAVDPDGEDNPDEDGDDDDEDGDPAFFRDAVGIAEEIGKKNSMVYIISEEEFHEEMMDEYPKISIYYYPAEDVLVDDRKVPIPNPFAVCGDFKSGFGKDPVNPHIVHVRNNRYKADFEISIVEGTIAQAFNYGRPQ